VHVTRGVDAVLSDCNTTSGLQHQGTTPASRQSWGLTCVFALQLHLCLCGKPDSLQARMASHAAPQPTPCVPTPRAAAGGLCSRGRVREDLEALQVAVKRREAGGVRPLQAGYYRGREHHATWRLPKLRGQCQVGRLVEVEGHERGRGEGEGASRARVCLQFVPHACCLLRVGTTHSPSCPCAGFLHRLATFFIASPSCSTSRRSSVRRRRTHRRSVDVGGYEGSLRNNHLIACVLAFYSSAN